LPVDFVAAARRHFSDGTLLRDTKRLPNADQLFGLSVECALKAFAVALGVPVDPGGELAEHAYKTHVNILWDMLRGLATGRRGAWFFARLPEGSPFSDWNIAQRYWDDQSVRPSAVEDHFKAARSIMTTLERASERGDVS